MFVAYLNGRIVEMLLSGTGGNCGVGMAPSGDITDKGACFPKTVHCGTQKATSLE